MSDFTLSARSRNLIGKGACRRLRRLDAEVPAIVYGGKKPPQSIAILHKELYHQLQQEAFSSHIISLVIDGKKQDVILKDLQRHPVRDAILHADFQLIDKAQKIHTRVPLHFINEDNCVGVKLQGGTISHTMTELEITCLPKNLPEFIEVDMIQVEEGQILHLSDIELPEGVDSVALLHGDHPIASVHIYKQVEEEETPEAVEEGEGEEQQEGEDEDDQ